MSELPAGLYVISPEPAVEDRSAIVEALERVAREDEAQAVWAGRARREAVDDRLD